MFEIIKYNEIVYFYDSFVKYSLQNRINYYLFTWQSHDKLRSTFRAHAAGRNLTDTTALAV